MIHFGLLLSLHENLLTDPYFVLLFTVELNEA
jgi:hypothetical protein